MSISKHIFNYYSVSLCYLLKRLAKILSTQLHWNIKKKRNFFFCSKNPHVPRNAFIFYDFWAIIDIKVSYSTLKQKLKVWLKGKNCNVQFSTISSLSSNQNVYLLAADEFSISEVIVVKPIFFIYFSPPCTILTLKYALYTYSDLNYEISSSFTIFMSVSVLSWLLRYFRVKLCP